MGWLTRMLGLEQPDTLAITEKGSEVVYPYEPPGEGGYVDLPVESPAGGWTTAWSNGVPILDPGEALSNVLTGGLPGSTAAHIYRTQPQVRKVIEFIARNIASVPFNLYERVSDDERRKVDDHPIATLLKNPTPQTTAFRFFNSIVSDWLLYDRWAALSTVVDVDGLERPILQRLPARRTSFVGDNLDNVTDIKVAFVETGTGSRSYAPERCAWDFGYSPTGVGGITPMITLAQILAEASEAVKWRREVWANGARVNGYIHRPADAPNDGWDSKARRRAEDEFNARFSATGSDSGSIPLLDDGMELRQAKLFTAADMQDYEIRQLTAQEVASAFHIAPELVGAREGTYSNVKEYRQALYRDSLGSAFVAIEQALNLALVADEPSLYIEANIDAKLRGTFDERAQSYVRASGRPYLTTNEVRKMENRPTVPGGDDLVTPLNVTLGGQATPVDPSGDGGDHEDANPEETPDEQARAYYPQSARSRWIAELAEEFLRAEPREDHLRRSLYRAAESALILAAAIYGTDPVIDDISLAVRSLSRQTDRLAVDLVDDAIRAGFRAAWTQYTQQEAAE